MSCAVRALVSWAVRRYAAARQNNDPSFDVCATHIVGVWRPEVALLKTEVSTSCNSVTPYVFATNSHNTRMPPARLELTALALEGPCSVHLSYGGGLAQARYISGLMPL